MEKIIWTIGFQILGVLGVMSAILRAFSLR